MNLLKIRLLQNLMRCMPGLALVFTLAACGQRGPLYLPAPPAAKPAPQQQLPAKSDDGAGNPTSPDDIKTQKPAR